MSEASGLNKATNAETWKYKEASRRSVTCWTKPGKPMLPKIQKLLTNDGDWRCRLGWHRWKPFEFPPKISGETCIGCMRMRKVEKWYPKGELPFGLMWKHSPKHTE